MQAHQWQSQSSQLSGEVSYSLHLIGQKHRNPTLYAHSLVLFRDTKIINFQHPLHCFRQIPLIHFLMKTIKKTSHLILHLGLYGQLSTQTQRLLPLLPCLGKGLCQELHLYQHHGDASFLQQVTAWRLVPWHSTPSPTKAVSSSAGIFCLSQKATCSIIILPSEQLHAKLFNFETKFLHRGLLVLLPPSAFQCMVLLLLGSYRLQYEKHHLNKCTLKLQESCFSLK